MKARPGSVGWLWWHELRLLWFAMGSGKTGKAGRRPGLAGLATIAVAWLALHGVAYVALRRLEGLGGAVEGDPRVLVAVSALLFGCMSFMLSSALKSCVLVLFERGDLDLLLSSPLSSHSIFAVRLGTVAVGTAALYLFFLTPFAHAGALLGHAGWLAVYPVMLGMGTVVACAAMLMTLGLVRLIGARRTRIVAQVIGAFAGASIFLLSQLFAHFSSSMETRAMQAFTQAFGANGVLGSGSPLWLPGRALLGEPLPVLGTTLLAAAAFVLTARCTHRFFVHGLQQAASSGRTARKPAGGLRFQFGHSLFTSVLFKEWRLIVRDPHLISQVALQLVYLLPLFFIIFRRGDFQMPAIAAGLTLLCSSITASLAWIVVSAEDAPDLLRLAPASASTVRLAKLASAVLPSLAIVALPLVWLVQRAAGAGLLVAFTVIGAVCSAALIVHWCGRPGLRSDYLARGKSDFLTSILEMFNSLSWGALAWSLASLTGERSDRFVVAVSFSALAPLVTLVFSWCLRRPQA